jgi:hypothetical protein
MGSAHCLAIVARRVYPGECNQRTNLAQPFYQQYPFDPAGVGRWRLDGP